jgi:hypothetical protein
MRRVTTMLAVCCAVALGAALLGGTPAGASTGYGLTGSFGSKGAGAGQFEEPTSVAVNDATHDVYVFDSGNGRVQEFDATGAHVLDEIDGSTSPTGAFASLGGPSAVAVDDSGKAPLEDPSVGDVYVVDAGHKVVDKFSESGVYLGQIAGTCENPGEAPSAQCPGSTSKAVIAFGEIDGVAVSPDGIVWVSQRNGTPSGEVDSFSDAVSGAFLMSVRPEDCCGGLEPGLAVDGEHNIYAVIQGYPGQPAEISDTGAILSYGISSRSPDTTDMALNPANNDVFIDEVSEIEEHASIGGGSGLISSFGSPHLSGGDGLTVSNAGTLYVADRTADRVLEFNEGPRPVAPVTEAAGDASPTTARLSGTLKNPGKEALEYHFIYNIGEACTEGGQTPSVTLSKAEAEKAEIPVSIEATGLTPSAHYAFCLVATNIFGNTEGAEKNMTTLGAAPVVEGLADSGVGAFAVRFEAQVNAQNQPTTCVFEYGTSRGTYGRPTACEQGAPRGTLEGYGLQSASVNVEELRPATIYYYRLLTKNATGQAEAQGQFTTLPVPTILGTSTVSEITQRTALVTPTIDPQSEGEASYYVVYGPSETYEAATAHASAGSGFAANTAAPVLLYGLQPGTTYHYKVVAVNANGPGESSGETFTTPAAPAVGSAPAIGTQAAQFVSEDSALVEAELNPEGGETTYQVQYGTTVGYGLGAPASPAQMPPFTSATAELVPLVQLAPGTTYHYRLLATNSAGTSYGPDQTFTTTGAALNTRFTAFSVPTAPLIAVSPIALPGEAPGTIGSGSKKVQKKKRQKTHPRKHTHGKQRKTRVRLKATRRRRK